MNGPIVSGDRFGHAGIGPFVSKGEHAVVLEGSSISDLAGRMEHSLIGRNVKGTRGPVKSSAYRLVPGGNSDVGICGCGGIAQW